MIAAQLLDGTRPGAALARLEAHNQGGIGESIDVLVSSDRFADGEAGIRFIGREQREPAVAQRLAGLARGGGAIETLGQDADRAAAGLKHRGHGRPIDAARRRTRAGRPARRRRGDALREGQRFGIDVPRADDGQTTEVETREITGPIKKRRSGRAEMTPQTFGIAVLASADDP